MAEVIYTTLEPEKVREFVYSLPGALAGTGVDPHGIGEGFRARLGWSFYSMALPNFDRLGRGGVGDDGAKWKPNTPEYLAYGKGPPSTRRGLGQMPMNRLGGPGAHGGQLGRGAGTGDLSRAELRQWWSIYGKWKAFFATRLPLPEAKARAAAMAWQAIKKRGAGTKLERLGKRPDQVLVDRGQLRRSIMPGEITEDYGPHASYKPANAEQLFDEAPGEVVVGSRNEHAATHHEGRGRMPERRLWPERLPENWWTEIYDQTIEGLTRIRELFGGAGQ